MFREIGRNKKLSFVAIISLFIPGTYFCATREDINFYAILQIFYATLFIFSFAFILSLILKKIIKKNFLHTLSSILLSFFIFFTYHDITRFTHFLLGDTFLIYHEEFSFFITIFLSIIFFILSIKKSGLFINFLAIFFSINSFYQYNKCYKPNYKSRKVKVSYIFR